jgi:large subunit ribosomal protein L16
MKWGHFEMARLGILRKMDQNRMFALWRIDGPWQPVTKKVLYLASLSTPSIVANV